MNRATRILSVALLIAVGTAVDATARTWTDRTGRTLEAEYVAVTGEKVRIKRTSDGRLFDVPLDRLSDVDQEFVKSKNAASDGRNDEAPPATTFAAPGNTKPFNGRWRVHLAATVAFNKSAGMSGFNAISACAAHADTIYQITDQKITMKNDWTDSEVEYKMVSEKDGVATITITKTIKGNALPKDSVYSFHPHKTEKDSFAIKYVSGMNTSAETDHYFIVKKETKKP